MENEGQVVNRPPLFKGVIYDYWKQRMIAFFESYHIGMLDMVENWDHIPYGDNLNEFPKSG